ncbi:MAG TPA: hypothetical protein VGP24_04510 [Glaciihabitans sp.]|jgi:hypothetical protein|nr:hypothetical protein [Glaciihabitans sp.]
METIPPAPGRSEAAADLDAVVDAQHAVRNRPWPKWIYPANTVLLGAMALSPLVEDPERLGVWIVVMIAVFTLNYWAGQVIGTPFALPTSRIFLAAVATSGLFLVAALAIGSMASAPWVVVGCAAGSMVSYGIGSVVHYRSTRR